MRTLLAVRVFLATLLLPAFCRAEVETRAKTERTDDDTVDIGVLGGIGFPRPLSIEPVIVLDRTVMFGAEYSFLPKTTVSSVDVRMWAVAADLRVFPFRGAFFV